MRPFKTTLRRWLVCLVWMLTGVCAAQKPFFNNQPKVQLTGGRVTSFVTGIFQTHAPGTDILFINAATGSGASSSVLVGEHLSPIYGTAAYNSIIFTGVTNVVAAVADFDDNGNIDYAFALTPAVTGTPNLCIYYGTGSSSNSSYNNGPNPNGWYSSYPPAGGTSGCIVFPITPLSHQPKYSYIAGLPLTTHSKYPQFMVEDSANSLLYILSNNGSHDFSSTTTNFQVLQTISLPDGAGPIYVGDFDHDGNTDFIIDGQTNGAATVYFGDGTGNFPASKQIRYPSVYSMLLYDMDGDGTPDMVAEGTNGALSIFQGSLSRTAPFATTSEATFPLGDGLSGHGGHLALINNINGAGQIEILTTTAMGLSVFKSTGNYIPSYSLETIYNIGPGRTSFALGNSIVYASNTMDLAIDGPEGIVVLQGDGSGGFPSSNAFPTDAPALSAVVGQFRNTQHNPTGLSDVLVATGAAQSRLNEGFGNGVFVSEGAYQVNQTGGPNLPSTLWSNVVAGDFNNDKNLDIAYTLTGTVGSAVSPSLYVQYGNGDGTFQDPVAVNPGAPNGNTFYGSSVVGDFNGDGFADIANIDSNYVDTLLGQSSTTTPFTLGMNQTASGNSLNLIAAGYFTTTTSAGVAKTSKQDLITLQGSSLIPYANSGDGKNFPQKPALTGGLTTAGYAVSALLLADVNDDGYGDVIAIYHNLASDPSNPSPSTPNYLYIWYGKGDGTFSTTPFTVPLDRNFYMAAVADINNDGFTDIVLSDGYLVAILFNNDSTGTTGNFVADCTTNSTAGLLAGSCSSGAEEHYLAGQGINAIVPVALAGDNKMDLVVANGGLTISNPLVLGGAAQTSASLAIDPVVNTGGFTVLMNAITTQPVNGTITVYDSSYPSASSLPLEPSSYTQAFTLVAVITPTNGATTVPGGTATFYIDGVEPAGCTPQTVTVTNLPSGAPAYSAATYCQIPTGNTYPVGTYSLKVVYSGDINYSSLTYTGSHTISGATTNTYLYLCIVGSTGCPATGTPTTPSSPSLYPTSLSMIYGQSWNGTWQVVASDRTSILGNFELFDLYNGTSSQLCDVVNKPAAECSPAVGTSEGTAVGTHFITGEYVPGTADTVHTGSTSTPVTIMVLQDPGTQITVAAGSPNPASFGASVTFTATVSGTYAAPTGAVSFNYGSTVLCSSQTLTPSATGVTSTATCSTSTPLPIGSDQIMARYAATTDFAAASSPAYTETITPPLTGNFNVTVTPNPVSVGVGYGWLLTVTVTPNNGFAQDVTLSCGNLPSEASCTFSPTLIAGGSGATTLFLNTAAPHTCGTSEPYFVGKNGGGLLPMALPALAGLIAIFIPGRRRIGQRWLRSLLAVLLTAGAMQITGCSTTCTDLGTKPGSYTFQVLGTAAGTGEVESQAVTLTVTI